MRVKVNVTGSCCSQCWGETSRMFSLKETHREAQARGLHQVQKKLCLMCQWSVRKNWPMDYTGRPLGVIKKDPARITLLLLCLLSIHSGVAQYASKGGCCYTGNPKSKPSDAMFKLYKAKLKSYEECQHSKVRLQFEKGQICASKHDEWVKELICHIKPDSTDDLCAKYKDSRSGPDYSKGSEEKAPPTTPPARADPNVASSSNPTLGGAVTEHIPTSDPSVEEAASFEYSSLPGVYEDVTIEYPVSPREFAVGNQQEKDSKRLEDFESTTGKKEGVTASIKTAIISLVLISLFLVALITFLICRRRKGPEPAREHEKVGLSSSQSA